MAPSEVSSSFFNRNEIRRCIFREKINGEKVEFLGEVYKSYSGEIRIRVRLNGSKKNDTSFDLSVLSKFPVEEEDESWTVTNWILKDSLVFKQGKREDVLPYLVLPARLHNKGGLPAERLCLEFKITVRFIQAYNTTTVSQSATSWTTAQTASSLCEDNRHMLLSGSCSDFRIHLPQWGWTKDVHRFILASRSPVLRAMIVSQMRETISDVLTLVDTHPAAVNRFLQLLYLGKLEGELEGEGKESLKNIFDTAVLCDKFGRPDFADLCCSICKSLFVDSTSEELVHFLSHSRCYNFAEEARQCALEALAPMQTEIEDFEVMRELLRHVQNRMYIRISAKRSIEYDGEMSENSRDRRRRRLG